MEATTTENAVVESEVPEQETPMWEGADGGQGDEVLETGTSIEPKGGETSVEKVDLKIPEGVVLEAPKQEAPQQDYATWRANHLAELTKNYAIPQDHIATLLSEPEKILPALAAAIHMRVAEHVMNSMQGYVPSALESHTAYMQRETQARNAFTQANPDLADPKLEPLIMKMGAAYRDTNPKATPEEACRAIGAMVRSTLGVAMPQGNTAAGTKAPAPKSAKGAPFKPARGAGGAPVAQAGETNPFSALAEAFLKDM